MLFAQTLSVHRLYAQIYPREDVMQFSGTGLKVTKLQGGHVCICFLKPIYYFKMQIFL